MRFTAHSLRSLVPALAIAVLATLASTSATAQSRFNVPFSFVANGQTCPAGAYTLHINNWGSVVTLEGSGQGFKWLIGPGPSPSDSRVMLTFDHAGSNYALRTVQYKSQITARLDKKFKERIAPAQQVAMLSQITISASQE